MGKQRKMKNKNGSWQRHDYLLLSVFSLLIFCGIYGHRILDPQNIDWLLRNGKDLTQHYLGWKAYRYSSWHFPPGMTDNLAYPYLTSVIFTDSIPILAFVFKLLSPLLPENFQYFGLFGGMTFILQACFSARIIKEFTKNRPAVFIAGSLFTISPVLIFRLFGHTALASQWIILYALAPLFVYKNYKDNNRIFLTAAILGFLSGSVHLYYLVFNGIIVLAYCVLEILSNRKMIRAAALLTVYLAVSALFVWLWGGFSSGMQPDMLGLGIYSANLNALINPQEEYASFSAEEWSVLSRPLPLYNGRQYEGFGWVGTGVLVLFVLSLFYWNKTAFPKIKRYKNEIISLSTAWCIAAMITLSPTVTFNEHKLYTIPLPQMIIQALSVFRATGRFVWINVYILMLCTCIVFVKHKWNKTVITVCLLLCLLIQIFDLQKIFRSRYTGFSDLTGYHSILRSEFWNELARSGQIKHIVYYSSFKKTAMYPFTDYALDHDMTVNNYNFARSVDDLAENSRKEALAAMPGDTIFIISLADHPICGNENLSCYYADDYFIGIPEKTADEIQKDTWISFDELESMDDDLSAEYEFQFGNNYFLKNGTDKDGHREVYAGGISYGPYITLLPGTYEVTITGEDLDSAAAVCKSDSGKKKVESTFRVNNARKIIYTFVLPDITDNVETVVQNTSENETVTIHSIRI